MLIADMIHSCSNEKIAQAALACIGGRFAERVHVAAAKHGVSTGRFVSIVVRGFARRATDDALASLHGKIAGADVPLLQGLQHVVEHALGDELQFVDDKLPAFEPGLYGASVWGSPLQLH
jgi:hypothetical protein